jgi:hypothetical protein
VHRLAFYRAATAVSRDNDENGASKDIGPEELRCQFD